MAGLYSTGEPPQRRGVVQQDDAGRLQGADGESLRLDRTPHHLHRPHQPDGHAEAERRRAGHRRGPALLPRAGAHAGRHAQPRPLQLHGLDVRQSVLQVRREGAAGPLLCLPEGAAGREGAAAGVEALREAGLRGAQLGRLAALRGPLRARQHQAEGDGADQRPEGGLPPAGARRQLAGRGDAPEGAREDGCHARECRLPAVDSRQRRAGPPVRLRNGGGQRSGGPAGPLLPERPRPEPPGDGEDVPRAESAGQPHHRLADGGRRGQCRICSHAELHQ